MANKDSIKLVGHVSIKVLEGRTGRVLRVVETKNLIVNGAKHVVAELLCADMTGRYQIWGIGAGNSVTAPSVSDTDLLGGKTFKRMFTSRTHTDGGVITVVTTFGTTEGNVLGVGESFTEAGLFTRGNSEWVSIPPTSAPANIVMLSRQIHAPVPKTPANALQYTWTFEIMSA